MQPLTQTLLAILIALPSLMAKDFYISPNGRDEHDGSSIHTPFATLQKAANVMSPGDTCYIRKGSYHQTLDLSGIAGEEGRPLTFRPYKSEKVLLDGTQPITSKWIVDEGMVYKTRLTTDITQLFVNDHLMTLARFPNATAFSDLVWHRSNARISKTKESTNGTITCRDDHLAQLDTSLNNCVALMNFGAHATGTRLVENHKAGSNSFTYSPALHKYKLSDFFFFEGGVNDAERALLDSSEEWAYDESTKTLFFWPKNVDHLSQYKLRGKQQTYAITGDASTKYITIEGLSFFATTFSFTQSDFINIQECDFDYYAASKRSLGVLGPSETAQFIGSEGDTCQQILIYNCVFKNADASALQLSHVDQMTIENNLFENIDYACANNDRGTGQPFSASTAIRVSMSKDFIYRRNSFRRSGNAQTLAVSYETPYLNKKFRAPYYEPEKLNPPLFEDNLFTECGLLHTDGSALYMAHSHVRESITRRNWFINNGQRDFRYDGDNTPLQGVHGNLYRNVVWGTPLKRRSPSGGDGFRVKGAYHEVYHNLGLGCSDINIEVNKGGNEGTQTRNNVAKMLGDHPMPGEFSNNYREQKTTRSVASMLRNPSQWDFRPKSDAQEIIDQGIPLSVSVKGKSFPINDDFHGLAPDLGPYEYGDHYYWIPGRQSVKASMPIPKNQSQNISLDTDLIYLIGLKGEKAAVYFGTNASNMKVIKVQTASENIVIPEALRANTTYYWRVDTKNSDDEVIQGDTWSFTTTFNTSSH